MCCVSTLALALALFPKLIEIARFCLLQRWGKSMADPAPAKAAEDAEWDGGWCWPESNRCAGKCCVGPRRAFQITLVLTYAVTTAYGLYMIIQCAEAYERPNTTRRQVSVDGVAAPGFIGCAFDAPLTQYQGTYQRLIPLSAEDAEVCNIVTAAGERRPCQFSYLNYSFSTIATDPRLCIDVSTALALSLLVTVEWSGVEWNVNTTDGLTRMVCGVQVPPGQFEFRNTRDFLRVFYLIGQDLDPETGKTYSPINAFYYGLYATSEERSSAILQLSSAGGVQAVSVMSTEYHSLKHPIKKSFVVTGISSAEQMFGKSEVRHNNTRYFQGEMFVYTNNLVIDQTWEEPSISIIAAMGAIAGVYGIAKQVQAIFIGETGTIADFDDPRDPEGAKRIAKREAAEKAKKQSEEAEKQRLLSLGRDPSEFVQLPTDGLIHSLFVFEEEASIEAGRTHRLASSDIRQLNSELAAGNQQINMEMGVIDRNTERLENRAIGRGTVVQPAAAAGLS